MVKILLVVDLQKQFKDENGVYEKCLNYLYNNCQNYDCVLATYFSQTIVNGKTDTNNLFIDKLHWDGCKQCNVLDLGLDFSKITSSNMILVGKNTYAPHLRKYPFFKENAPNNIHFDIIGCDADACIMATCFKLWDLKIDFTVLTDYLYSNCKDVPYKYIIALLKRNFGDCIK